MLMDPATLGPGWGSLTGMMFTFYLGKGEADRKQTKKVISGSNKRFPDSTAAGRAGDEGRAARGERAARRGGQCSEFRVPAMGIALGTGPTSGPWAWTQ